MAGVEGLQQISGFAAPDLAHDDMIRAVPQRVAHQVADRHRSFLQPARLESDAIGAINAKLQRVLDGDNALVLR